MAIFDFFCCTLEGVEARRLIDCKSKWKRTRGERLLHCHRIRVHFFQFPFPYLSAASAPPNSNLTGRLLRVKLLPQPIPRLGRLEKQRRDGLLPAALVAKRHGPAGRAPNGLFVPWPDPGGALFFLFLFCCAVPSVGRIQGGARAEAHTQTHNHTYPHTHRHPPTPLPTGSSTMRGCSPARTRRLVWKTEAPPRGPPAPSVCCCWEPWGWLELVARQSVDWMVD